MKPVFQAARVGLIFLDAVFSVCLGDRWLEAHFPLRPPVLA